MADNDSNWAEWADNATVPDETHGPAYADNDPDPESSWRRF